jgi:hypothetical protein
MRLARRDVRDHIASQKNGHGASYPRYRALQQRSRLDINICEILGVVRFSTFATLSPRQQTSSGRLHMSEKCRERTSRFNRRSFIWRAANGISRGHRRSNLMCALPCAARRLANASRERSYENPPRSQASTLMQHQGRHFATIHPTQLPSPERYRGANEPQLGP